MCIFNQWKTIESNLEPHEPVSIESELLASIHMGLQQAKTAILEADRPQAFRDFVCDNIDRDMLIIQKAFSDQS